jgi:hypothetical protein
MVICCAYKESSFLDSDECFDLLAEELVRLVEEGELESQGNLSKWRFSEVRLPKLPDESNKASIVTS